MITGIHHVSMKCEMEELDRVKDFYLNVLGLSLKREWEGGVMFDTGNGLIEIFTNGGAIRELGAVRHYALATDDVDGLAARIREAGYEVFIEPKDIVIPSSPELNARMAFCFGPLSEQIELFMEK